MKKVFNFIYHCHTNTVYRLMLSSKINKCLLLINDICSNSINVTVVVIVVATDVVVKGYVVQLILVTIITTASSDVS